MIYAGLCVYSLLSVGNIYCELFELLDGRLNEKLFRDNNAVLTTSDVLIGLYRRPSDDAQ